MHQWILLRNRGYEWEKGYATIQAKYGFHSLNYEAKPLSLD